MNRPIINNPYDNACNVNMVSSESSKISRSIRYSDKEKIMVLIMVVPKEEMAPISISIVPNELLFLTRRPQATIASISKKT
jgi:hypothetical protein